MTLWFFRLVTIIIFPVIGWFKVSSDWKGIAVGVLVALFIIAVEIFMEHVPLSHLLLGLLGGGLGLIFAWFLNEDTRQALSVVLLVLLVRAVSASYTLDFYPFFASERF